MSKQKGSNGSDEHFGTIKSIPTDQLLENGTDVSRRSFLKGVGTGVVSSVVIPAVVLAGEELEKYSPIKEGVKTANIKLNVNGEIKNINVESRTTLSSVLRNKLNLTGTKEVCNRGECGGCTVLIDGVPTYSCISLAIENNGKEITTIEGLAKNGKLSNVQQAFVDKDAYQCGYCTPGQIITATALVKNNPNPSADEIKKGMSGNLCRCSAYPHIFEAVAEAAKMERG